MAGIRGHRAGRRRPSKPTPAPCKPAYSVSDPHIICCARSREPQRREHRQSFASPGPAAPGVIDPGTGQPAKNESGPPPIARKRTSLNAGITHVGANPSAPLPLLLRRLRDKVLLIHEYMRGPVGGLARGGHGVISRELDVCHARVAMVLVPLPRAGGIGLFPRNRIRLLGAGRF